MIWLYNQIGFKKVIRPAIVKSSIILSQLKIVQMNKKKCAWISNWSLTWLFFDRRAGKINLAER